MSRRLAFPIWLLLALVLCLWADLADIFTSAGHPNPSHPGARSDRDPVPPRPVVPYTPMPPELLAPVIVQRSPRRGEVLAR